MRTSIIVMMLVAMSVGGSRSPVRPGQTPPTPAPTPIKTLTPELKAQILQVMRLNRQAFQESKILQRYGEHRPPVSSDAFGACDLPRTTTGEPAAQYPAEKARAAARPYTEAAVIDCLGTTGGLAGTRAKPLQQHYYCGLPGFSPDIRGCFTFQLRLTSVSPRRSAVDDEGYLPNGSKVKLEKAWKFIGTDPDKVPDPRLAFGFCVTDGRPATIKNARTGKELSVETIHPTPTKPMCWIAQTQADLFQGIMSGLIDPPVADQIALLKEYYECSKIKGKVSAARFKAMCEIDASEFE